MKGKTNIRYLFMDIGGVLLTDGWVHEYRKLAAKKFHLNPEKLEKRYNQAFDTYAEGKLTIAEYLSRVVFYEKRSFTPYQFRNFMFAQSKPFHEMIELIRRLKAWESKAFFILILNQHVLNLLHLDWRLSNG